MPCPISLEEAEEMLAAVSEEAVEQTVKEISKAQRSRIDTAISASTRVSKSPIVLVLA